MRSRTEMVGIVLAAPALQEKITELVRDGAGDEPALREKARKYCLEIAADYNGRWLGLWDKVLSRLWRIIYEDFVVDQEGLERIRLLFRRRPCVIIPCHKSHVDYLILSYIFFKHNLPLPHIAAGENMNFWPLGAIFRQSGAFFLRRSFRGDELYAAVFAAYLETLLKEGVPVEFFLEGGRSRTGKMVAPKYGMLAMILRSFIGKAFDDLSLIPVYIGYDRVIEVKSYLRELTGGRKKRESTLDVFRQFNILKHRYGNVYLQIGNPISLKACFSRPAFAVSAKIPEELQALSRDVGRRLVSEINRVAVATPTSLLAAALLCHGEKETPADLLQEISNAFYDYLANSKVNLAPALAASWVKARKSALSIFIQEGCLVREKAGDEKEAPIYLVPDDERLRLEYYKNNIIHHFLPLSFLAAALLACTEGLTNLSRISEDYCFLNRVFRLEFMQEAAYDGAMEEAVAYLRHRGILDVGLERGEWKLKEGGREKLMFFAGLIRSCLESYGTVLKACLLIKSGGRRGESRLDFIRQQAKEMHARGMIRRTESMSGASYSNALKFLEEEAVISQDGSHAAASGAAAGVLVDETKLADLQRRLSRFG